MSEIDLTKKLNLGHVAVIKNWAKGLFLQKADAEKMMASKIHLTFGEDFVGQAYTVAGGASEYYTGTVPADGVVDLVIKEMDSTYTVQCSTAEGIAYEREINIGYYYGRYPLDFQSFIAYLHVKADVGSTVTAVLNGKSYTGTPDRYGYCTINVGKPGTYTLTATLDGETGKPVTVEVTEAEATYEVVCPPVRLTIVTFADGTDEEVAAMLDAAKNGSIDLQTDGGWKVGDTRRITISAFTSGDVNHSEQEMDIVITSFADYNSCGAKMQFDFKQALSAGNRMNASGTNSGGWKSSEMFKTTLPALVKALPEWLSSRLLEFPVKACVGGGSSNVETVTGNKLALRSEIEIFGKTTYSASGEGGTQIEYYKTAANRVKKYGLNGNTCSWWERSAYASYTYRFCCVDSSGSADYNNASDTYGVSPFGCI